MTKNLHNEFERLENQDPASGVDFDEAALLANLAGRLPQGTLAEIAPTNGSGEPEEAPAVSEVVPLRRRSIAWTQVAASAAVTALAVGGMAAFLNNGNADQDTTALMATEPGAPGDSMLVRPEGAGGPGLISEMSKETSVSNTSMLYGSGRSVFSASGLSEQGGTGNVFGFDSTEAVSKESFEQLKKTFGVTAKTDTSWGSFFAGGQNGDGPSLSLQGGADAAFSYSFNAQLPDTKAISEQETVAKAKAIMSELGIDAEAFTFEPSESQYYPWVDSAGDPGDVATIEPFIEDSSVSASSRAGESSESADSELSTRALPQDGETVASWVVSATLTDFGPKVWSVQWQFEFVGETLVSANGMLAKVVDLGEYEVISSAQGVERLNSNAFGSLNVFYPEDGLGIMPVMPGGTQTYSEDSAPNGVAAPAVGSSITWNVSDVELKDPRLAYASLYAGEHLQVVPVWRYTSAEGIDYEVLALVDAELEFEQ